MTPSQQNLALAEPEAPALTISPLLEMGAYEALGARGQMTFKKMADLFRQRPEALPSDLVPEERAREMAERVLELLRRKGVERFGVRVHRAGEYPAKLRDARHPVELLYYMGIWNWAEMRSVAVVGTREASEEALRRTRKLVGQLVADGFAIVSGLAEGIDTAAHRAALEADGVLPAVRKRPSCGTRHKPRLLIATDTGLPTPRLPDPSLPVHKLGVGKQPGVLAPYRNFC